MKKTRQPFSTRGFVSLLMTICFAGLALSGVILYFSPSGRIAEATGWTVLALTKTQWASLHQVTALAILILSVIHLFVFNWKTFLCYIRQKRAHRRKEKTSPETVSWVTRIRIPKEVLASVLFSVVLYVGAITLITPFGWLQEGSHAIRDNYRHEASESSDRGVASGGRSHNSIGFETPEGGESEGHRRGSGAGRGQGGGEGRGEGVQSQTGSFFHMQD